MAMRQFAPLAVAGGLLFAAASTAPALEIRAYAASRHDRFTGFPDSPVVNASAWFNGGLYAGVGWSPTDTRRQFALVSPRHFVLASHWPISPGEQIRFLGPDGQVHPFTVASSTQISAPVNGVPTPTDLTIGRLTEAIPLETGIAAFPYLKLPEHGPQSSYVGKSLQVFGFYGRVGAGTIVQTAHFDMGNGVQSQLMRFDYPKLIGDQDDCYFGVGDSGSPSFVIAANGKPGLVGTHSAINETEDLTTYRNFDTFVPFYVSQLNAAMQADGWQMIPSDAAANTLTRSAATNPSTLRQANAGGATFTVQNAANAANNLRVSLTFPAGAGPTSYTADGWIADATGPLTWSFHRQSLAASSSATITVQWTSVPAVASLPVVMRTQSDGSALQATTFTFTPSPSFAAWGAGLGQSGPNDDPEGDGVANLLEYAFGSDPAGGSALNSTGGLAQPAIRVAGGDLKLRFPVRTDSSSRGLWYRVEYSQTLSNDWTETAPAGTTTAFAAYSPDVPGFVEETVTIPSPAGRLFARVKVVLDESAPGMPVP